MSSRHRWATACALAMAAGGVWSARTSAQTAATWLTAANGNWNDPAQWSTNPAFPNNSGPTYNVLITPTGSPYTVTLNQPITITDLHLTSPDAILDLTTNDLIVAGDYFHSGAQLRGPGTSGTITVAGTTSFTGSYTGEALAGVSAFHAQNTLIFNPITTIDICDTDIYHDGVGSQWNGGNIILNEGSRYHEGSGGTFNITSNGTLSYTNLGAQSAFLNAGTIRKSAGSGVTFFSGVDLDNTGTVQVETGTLRSDRPVQVSGSTLTGGKWKVMGGSTVDLVGAAITTNQGDVTLDGTGSLFAAIDNLAINDTAGKLTIRNGRNFSTTPAAGDFTNNGSIAVGSATTFQVDPGHNLTNYNAGTQTLTGGTYAVSGLFKFSNPTGIRVDAADITMDGVSAAIQDTGGASALTALTTIAPTGAFTIQNIPTFTTGASDFTVAQSGAQKGTLTVGAGSLFQIPVPHVLTNLAGGDLATGRFNLFGKLQSTGASINTVTGAVALIGGGSHIIDELGHDAFQNLHTVASGGDLTVKQSQNLNITTPAGLTLRGRLAIGPDGADTPSTVTVDHDFIQDPGGILDLDGGVLGILGAATFNGTIIGNGTIDANAVVNGILSPGHAVGTLVIGQNLTLNPGSATNMDLGGTVAGSGYDQISILGTVNIAPTNTPLNVTLIDGFVPAFGDAFDVLLFNGRSGAFSTINLPGLSGSLFWEVHYLPGALELVVAPSPGGLGLMLAGTTLAGRRRRRS